MAKVEFSTSISQIHGKVDQWVYRQHNGQTLVAPYEKPEDNPTPAQTGNRQRFRDAQAYAKSVLTDPLKRRAYRKLGAARGCPPNALLVSNFLNPPVIEEVDLSAYHGQACDVIRAFVTDAIEVVSVMVAVRDADAVILETGAATKDHDLWVYRITTAPADADSATIEVTAQNRAGAKVTAVYPTAVLANETTAL